MLLYGVFLIIFFVSSQNDIFSEWFTVTIAAETVQRTYRYWSRGTRNRRRTLGRFAGTFLAPATA